MSKDFFSQNIEDSIEEEEIMRQIYIAVTGFCCARAAKEKKELFGGFDI